MLINFKSNTTLKTNKIYFLKVKNRSVIDITFDKLHKQSKLY